MTGRASTARRPALEVDELVAGYAGEAVLRGISFQVGCGEIVGVLGPNGSGKTTLLRCLTGALAPTRGRIRILGRPPGARSRRELALVVAVVPQNLRMPAGFSVHQVVTMGRHPHLGVMGVEHDHDRRVVEDALAATGLDDLAARDVDSLSGGERQRVVLALALAQEPRVLLLDEPTAHLDLRHRLAIFGLLAREVGRRGLTVVVVLHDPNLAGRICDRLLLLRAGRRVAYGPPDRTLGPELLGECLDVRLRAVRRPEGGPDLVIPAEVGLADRGESDRDGAAADAPELRGSGKGRRP